MADARIEERLAEIEKLTDLDGVRAQRAAEECVAREREEAEADRQKRMQDMQRELRLSIETVLDRIQRAEGLLRSYGDEVEGILSEYQEISRLCYLITGKSVPISVSSAEGESLRLSACSGDVEASSSSRPAAMAADSLQGD